MQTFSHELTHTIVGLMFGRKIHAFRATAGEGGEMCHSGGRFNATVILLSIRKGIVNAVTYLFPQYWGDILGFCKMIFKFNKFNTNCL
jgi:hypothetical protein